MQRKLILEKQHSLANCLCLLTFELPSCFGPGLMFSAIFSQLYIFKLVSTFYEKNQRTMQVLNLVENSSQTKLTELLLFE